MVTQGIEIGSGWTRKGETSARDYVSLSIAATEIGPKKIYANLGKVVGADDSRLNTVIWNPGDQKSSSRAGLCAGATENIC